MAFIPKVKGGKNFGVEFRGKTGLGLDPKDYTVYRRKSGDVVVVDKGYRRTKDEMKSWKKVGKDTQLSKTVSRMMVHDMPEGMSYRFTKASKTVAETEFLKPATQHYLGMHVTGWVDIRTGQFIARSPVQKFRSEGGKGDIEYEFASLDNMRARTMYEGYGLEEWYNQLSGIEKALINEKFATMDWKEFWQVYNVSSPSEKGDHEFERRQTDAFVEIVDLTEEVIPSGTGRSYRDFVERGLGVEIVIDTL